jgi:hypothetical protein
LASELLEDDRSGHHFDDPVVRPVRDSDCFVVTRGHARLRARYDAGASMMRVRVSPVPAWTPLQEELRAMSWLESRRQLYQPVDAPEIRRGDWVLVRRCTDRFEMMHDFLAARGLLPPETSSFLDVGASYGWFVAQMQRIGFAARGHELDPRAPKLAHALYRLDPDHIHVGDCASELPRLGRFDVVSCLSVMHHFALGRGSCTADEFLDRLAGATARVLFFDTGEAHETWLARELPEWTVPNIHEWLAGHPAFAEVVRLGVDGDDAPPFEGNYGRTLFACVRR